MVYCSWERKQVLFSSVGVMSIFFCRRRIVSMILNVTAITKYHRICTVVKRKNLNRTFFITNCDIRTTTRKFEYHRNGPDWAHVFVFKMKGAWVKHGFKL